VETAFTIVICVLAGLLHIAGICALLVMVARGLCRLALMVIPKRREPPGFDVIFRNHES
jgi:hypothetical protein